MDLIDRIGLAVHTQTAMGVDGSVLTLLVVKASFMMQDQAQTAILLPEQLPIAEIDVFEGAPGESAPRHESDLAPLKRRCDVLLNGSAYAPQGQAVTLVPVALRVGGLEKAFLVLGARYWESRIGGLRLSPAMPFARQALSYARAYGGYDRSHPDPAKHAACAENPVGIGFHVHRDPKAFDGQPSPQQLPLNQDSPDPWTSLPVFGLGAVGRNWQPRLGLAGRFNSDWQETRFPFLPLDFDPSHWQAAPADQQLDSLPGGAAVELVNLSPGGHIRFALPDLQLQAHAHRGQVREPRTLVADTLLLEPDLGRFSIVWRASWAQRRTQGEIDALELLPARGPHAGTLRRQATLPSMAAQHG